MEFKEKFKERYSKLTNIDKFIEFSLKEPRKSIRINTLKISIKELKERFENYNLKQIPWCKEGFFLDAYTLGNTLEHFLGYFYLQEAVSMIPPEVLKPREDDIVLDMCASPGSKTTQMAVKMNNNGLIVANESKFQRLKPLSINLERLGISNTLMTLMPGQIIKERFDKILVDAPCSGVGTIRRSIKTIETWNPNMIKGLCGLQKKLLFNAFNILNEGGTLIYSTCTLEPEEDEGVINSLIERFDNIKIEKINLDIKKSKAVTSFNGKEYSKEVKKCLRIYPQDNDTEGFFVAKIKKE